MLATSGRACGAVCRWRAAAMSNDAKYPPHFFFVARASDFHARQAGQHLLERDGKVAHPYPGRVEHRVRDRRVGPAIAHLTDPLGTQLGVCNMPATSTRKHCESASSERRGAAMPARPRHCAAQVALPWTIDAGKAWARALASDAIFRGRRPPRNVRSYDIHGGRQRLVDRRHPAIRPRGAAGPSFPTRGRDDNETCDQHRRRATQR
jgi:hypothetical protein